MDPKVRKMARLVAKETKQEPWHEHRAEVLPEVYRRLGSAFTATGKRRAPAPVVAPAVECAVCMEENPLVTLVPCGHRRICRTCAARVRGKCPICRAAFRDTLARVFD